MIQCIVYDAAGNKVGSVNLALRKSDAAWRLQTKFFQKGSGVVPRDMDALDAGTLSLSRLSLIYSPAEIRAAIVKQADSLRKSADETDAILAQIESAGLWAAGGLRKSHARASDEVAEVLKKYGYEGVDGKDKGSRKHFAHRGGHTVFLDGDARGSWRHSKGPRGKGADELSRLLASLHGAAAAAG